MATGEDLRYGDIRVLPGEGRGAYPDGNTVLISGTETTLLIDPSRSVAARADLPATSAILVSHAHQDHMAGLGRYADTPVFVHQHDLPHVQSLAAQVSRYGLAAQVTAEHAEELAREFRLADRPDALPLHDGQTFELGRRTVTVVHLPGHTAGHCGFMVEPDGFLFLGDIDLSSFGPYYGDLGSSLEQFEASIARCRSLEARWYATFHHKGVYEGTASFREALDAYSNTLTRRDSTLMKRLSEPSTLDELAEQRLLYPPQYNEVFTQIIERRTIERHLDRLLRQEAVAEIEPGLFRTV